ncbi:type I glutamate--ammonia ligase [Candidatus Peregrinibacteria bacterium CG11_big_fil_rev_8_21_14_0_20_46_8]|nr:MAG: type I glutamate--ammonia ligase [Candidatus Peregrinibacteria bacterium CG11_big_fil_rev_8_21_14_0_20_46_8]
MIKARGIKIVDFRFVDLLGLWQHFSIPVEELLNYKTLEDSMWVDGIGFDGSSIRGFQAIDESDMMLIPDPTSAFVDPILQIPTINIICDVYDPIHGEPYSRDPRYVARKAEAYLKTTGIADQSYWGPEAEFFIFDHISYDQNESSGYYFIDSEEADWNTGKGDGNGSGRNLGYKPRMKEGYFPCPPHDTLQDIRSEIIRDLIDSGIRVEVHHHEVATGGQCEIDMRYNTMTRMADQVLMYKYIIKNVARKHGKVATFMPKPIFNDNGSGMHCHQSLWMNGKPLFYEEKGYAHLSQMAKYYIGGLIKHGPALMAFCAPTTNSYKRLVPGFEAPVNLVYSKRNRSAAIRIPMYSEAPAARRVEFRSPDPTCNPYLAFAAMMMAGLDGIQNKIEPGEPLEQDLFTMDKKKLSKIKTMPGSLSESIDALEKDHEFLLKGGVFTQDLIDTWITWKREKEIDELRLRPHPHEFYMYFDA